MKELSLKIEMAQAKIEKARRGICIHDQMIDDYKIEIEALNLLLAKLESDLNYAQQGEL